MNSQSFHLILWMIKTGPTDPPEHMYLYGIPAATFVGGYIYVRILIYVASFVATFFQLSNCFN